MEELRTIARPYASAVFDIASNKDTLKEWSIFLKKTSKLLDQQDIKTLIKTPGLNKKTIAEIFFEASVEESETSKNKELFSNFLNVLSENKRLNIITMVSSQFEQKKKQQAEQVSEVLLSSAAALSEEDVEEIKQALSKKLGKKIELKNSVDETLIGGALIKIGDHMIDGSVRSQLKKMTRFLTN
ncbi:F0F1 ATP synthase subunit delta [Gammaproteobacteria bacterium]|nr:F0F1 ATP synthase subunit delta [Gammaproteobacteria bacterium]